MTHHNSWASLLDLQAQRLGPRISFTFLGAAGEDERALSYATLRERAVSIASALTEYGLGGERVLLLLPWGAEYVTTLFACLTSGTVAVPVPLTGGRRSLARLEMIAADADCRLALTTSALSRGWEAKTPPSWMQRLALLKIDEFNAGGRFVPQPQLPSSTALLQYTSGSLSTPRGVVISHDNLRANLTAITSAFGVTSDDIIVSWLPLFHDMGLVGTLLETLFVGATSVLMSPSAFVNQPLRWLREIAARSGTIAGGPNSAYRLCIEAAQRANDIATLDLRSWRTAFCGAELVEEATAKQFAATFASCNFNPTSFVPCYGLAEATLLVTSARHPRPELTTATISRAGLQQHIATNPRADADARTVVSCGQPAPGVELRIDGGGGVDNAVGEVVVGGASVAAGYHCAPEATTAMFVSDPHSDRRWLRTGDIGFMRRGELFVLGRRKAMLVARGRNYFADDLEQTVRDAHPALQYEAVAAFSFSEDQDGQIAIAFELAPARIAEATDILRVVMQSIVATHEVRPMRITAIRHGALPRTTSGKIRRHETARLLAAGSLHPLAEVDSRRGPSAVTHHETRANAAELTLAMAQMLGVTTDDLNRSSLVSLGLDSIKAIELAHELEARFGVECPATTLLTDDMGMAVALRIMSDSARHVGTAAHGADRSTGGLSYGQQGLLLREYQAGARHINTLARALHVPHVPPSQLAEAVRVVAKRHQALRAMMVRVGVEDIPQLQYHDEVDVRILPPHESISLRERLRHEAQRQFADNERLFAVLIWPDGEGTTALFVASHLVMDLWSMAILLRDTAAFLAGDSRPDVIGPQFDDYVTWERSRCASPRSHDVQRYWSERLAALSQGPPLPSDRPAATTVDYSLATIDFDLTAEDARAIKSLAGRCNATPYAVCVAAAQIVLSRLSGKTDVALTGINNGRWHQQWKDVVGYCAGPIILRAQVDGAATVSGFVAGVAKQLARDYEHADLPFHWVVSQLGRRGEELVQQARHFLCAWQAAAGLPAPTVAALALNRDGASLHFDGLDAQLIHLTVDDSEYALALMLADDGERISGQCRYRADRVEAEAVRGFLEAWRQLVTSMAVNSTAPLATLPLAPPGFACALPSRFEMRPTGEPQSLHAMLRAAADRWPERVAVTTDDSTLTYQELWQRASSMAAVLRQHGSQWDDRVAICVERSADMVVAAAGTLLAGAAYVPLEPEWPSARLIQVIEDSGARLLIQGRTIMAPWLPHAVRRVWVDDQPTDGAPLPTREEPDALAYLIYTSGSTGRPKGVAVAHRQVADLLAASRQMTAWGATDRWSLSHSFAFDFSVWEMWMPLTSGGSVAVAPLDTVRHAALYRSWLDMARINVLCATPTVFRQLSTADERTSDRLGHLRTVVFGGEALQPTALRGWIHKYGDEQPLLFNMYGITETTVHVTCRRITAADAQSHSSPIGLPLPGARTYVMDDTLHLLPDGLTGELAVAGTGLARGYWNLPMMTAERFVPDPFSDVPGSRLYRSGDMCQYGGDGTLVYGGRRDSQVKIRGHRIEIAEVESVLALHPDVSESAVLPHANTEGVKLVAYLSGVGETAEADLFRFLRQRLPSYMIAAEIVWLTALPVTVNGKVDRNALVDVPRVRTGTHLPQFAPETASERAVHAIWCEILERDSVSIDANFFDVGGHSLLIVQMLARINAEWNLELPVSDLFAEPTIRGIALALEQMQSSTVPR